MPPGKGLEPFRALCPKIFARVQNKSKLTADATRQGLEPFRVPGFCFVRGFRPCPRRWKQFGRIKKKKAPRKVLFLVGRWVG